MRTVAAVTLACSLGHALKDDIRISFSLALTILLRRCLPRDDDDAIDQDLTVARDLARSRARNVVRVRSRAHDVDVGLLLTPDGGGIDDSLDRADSAIANIDCDYAQAHGLIWALDDELTFHVVSVLDRALEIVHDFDRSVERAVFIRDRNCFRDLTIFRGVVNLQLVAIVSALLTPCLQSGSYRAGSSQPSKDSTAFFPDVTALDNAPGVWRRNATLIFDAARTCFCQEHLRQFASVEFPLRLMAAREDGELEPCEGILLVRNRA